ncbi:MAG: uncharacterized protein JWQ02_1474 [Capsulimonas sp.]|nr:uncharacterized protein [Capsulimonas sp.]
MTYYVIVTGSEHDLEVLMSISDFPRAKILRNRSDYVLSSTDFDGLSIDEIQSSAKKLINVLNGYLELLGLGTIVAQNAFSEQEGAIRTYAPITVVEDALFKDYAEAFEVQSDGTLISTTRKHSQALLCSALEDADIGDVLALLHKAQPSWVNLYRICERIGGKNGKTLIDNGWVSRTEYELFKRTACSRGAVGDEARHGYEDPHPPSKPMTIEEAKAMVYNLMRSWIASK